MKEGFSEMGDALGRDGSGSESTHDGWGDPQLEHDSGGHHSESHDGCWNRACTPKHKLGVRHATLWVFWTLSAIEVAFAAYWFHYLGLVASSICLVLTLALIVETAARQCHVLRGHMEDKGNGCCIAVRNSFTFTSGLLAVYVVLLIFVRLSSFSHVPAKGQWPTSCRSGTLVSCSRISVNCNSSNNDDGLAPQWLSVSSSQVVDEVAQWAALELQFALEASCSLGPGNACDPAAPVNASFLLHYRVLSVVWGFTDDLFVRVTPHTPHAVNCSSSRPHRIARSMGGTGHTTVEFHSEQRFGEADAGVNERRVVRLYEYLESQQHH